MAHKHFWIETGGGLMSKEFMCRRCGEHRMSLNPFPTLSKDRSKIYYG